MRRRVLHALNNVKIEFTYVGDIATGMSNAIRGIYVTPSGDRAFVINYTVSDIYVFDMSTNNNITTAIHTGTYNFGVTNCYGIHFSSDGLNVFSNNLNSGRLYRCALSTPFDLSTKGSAQTSPDYPNYSYYFSLETNSDGSRIYSSIASPSYNKIDRFDMSTPNNVTTTSFIEGYDIYSHWFKFVNSGNYIYNAYGNTFSIYRLTTPYELSTRKLIKTVASPVSFAYGTASNENNIYVLFDTNATGVKRIRQYSINVTGL